jgi:glycosyltransferase involved in cell wall biosynthesis
MWPSVSILIPTYARTKWLEEALYCALHQDYGGHIEVIVANDCVRQELICDYPYVRVINSSLNATLGSKRNRLIAAASGQYFVWLDDDDLALPWYVHRLVRPVVLNGATAVLSKNCFFLHQNAWRPTFVPIELLCDRQLALDLGGYPDDMDSGEDQVFRAKLVGAPGAVPIFAPPGAYVYRSEPSIYHISGTGLENPGDAFRRHADERIDTSVEPCGTVSLVPRLLRDYFENAPTEVLRRVPHAFRSTAS